MNDVIRTSKERNILDLAKNLQDELHVYCKGAAGSGDNFYARTFANLADRADELVKLLESAPETRDCRYPMSYGHRCTQHPDCECGRAAQKAEGGET